ncbi:Enoyl reductase LovC [Tolypocladium ophioglossoides CBS 100239]|uniref:Enoyl reductase LovC n=1 Tax=Tolypocladium ophioglossoides (strain CBS 100239) TaxID=1163406 RepID=A0A0L0N1S0_TOLOC|nr:Enoyl reductase LovC [Tolypocladium ophioglossoides CBS 100239]
MGQHYQTALVGASDGTIRLSNAAPVPEVTGDRVLIKTRAVSVNPVDTKMIGSYVTPGAVAGFDFAGVVEHVCPDATKCDIKVGDRVCTAIMGMNPHDPTVGAFAEHTAAVEWILLRIPPSLSFEEGASLGISFMTTGLALFKSLDLPGHPLEPCTQKLPVLVFGGSSATGTAAIQLLRLAGFDPVATCSPHNFDLVKSYGACAVFDYRAPGCTEDIKKYTKSGLRYALDCISTTASMQFCYQALGRAGGKYTSLEPYAEAVAQTRKVVRPDWIMGPQMLGKEIAWPQPHWRAADPEMGEFGATWTATLRKLLDKGLIRPHPIVVKQGGLREVLGGIEDIRSKKISGKKLVYAL